MFKDDENIPKDIQHLLHTMIDIDPSKRPSMENIIKNLKPYNIDKDKAKQSNHKTKPGIIREES